jgi:UDP-glucose 4-epimerase
VLASSSEVYGKSTNVPYKEDGDRVLGPTTINRWSYAAGKAIDEHMALNYHAHGLPVVILRFFNTYGPRINEQAYGTVIAQFIRQAFLGETITVHGTGHQVRCFTYVTDTVAGVLKSAEVKKAEGQIFNIGNPRPWNMVDLALLVKRLVHSKSEVKHVPYRDYYGLSYEDTPIRIPDISKAREVFDFNPSVSLEDGMRRTITWCRENYRSAQTQNPKKQDKNLLDTWSIKPARCQG